LFVCTQLPKSHHRPQPTTALCFFCSSFALTKPKEEEEEEEEEEILLHLHNRKKRRSNKKTINRECDDTKRSVNKLREVLCLNQASKQNKTN
jgi:hypothetical protein